MAEEIDHAAFRLYAADELAADGYPAEWHATIKHAVREQSGHRCVRCGHPYRKGEHGNGEWSPCDEQCTHAGPVRFREPADGDRWCKRDLTEIGITAAMCRMDEGPYGLAVRFEVEAEWRILTVHHLDGDKANCKWWNLAALCQRCHLTIQGRVRMEQVWPWDHSPWFRSYAAGYYASVYLGEDITRVQAEDRLDELLALERAV